MSVPPYHVVSLLLLLLPAVGLAQPVGLEPEPVARQLELGQTPRPVVWVAPGVPVCFAVRNDPGEYTVLQRTGHVGTGLNGQDAFKVRVLPD